MFLLGIAFKKKLEIIFFISLITFCSILLTRQILIIVNNVESNPQSVEIKLTTSTEPPLKSKLKSLLKCRDRPLQGETLQYGKYWLMRNYVRGRLSINTECAESITYTTNGDYTFMDNLATVVERWSAPVSFALYAPGYDYNATMDSIQYVRNCLPASHLIRDYVTFHIFFPNDHMPKYVAKNEEEALQWPHDCQLLEAPYENVNRFDMYKTQKNLTYPINVGRNIARKAVNTYFIFACDIELYPTLGVAQQFLQMIMDNPTIILDNDKLKVFPLPVFEITENATLPDSKEELQEMLSSKMAIPFHFYVCEYCHVIPKQQEWIKANITENLEVFSVSKRYDKFGSWEPFYISDNKEPIFDERVTWEGQSNKRIQNYAMCLMDYEYHVLHPAFLVHAPGIKKFNPKSNVTKQRLKYAKAMNVVIQNEIIPEYQVLYGKNKKCHV